MLRPRVRAGDGQKIWPARFARRPGSAGLPFFLTQGAGFLRKPGPFLKNRRGLEKTKKKKKSVQFISQADFQGPAPGGSGISIIQEFKPSTGGVDVPLPS